VLPDWLVESCERRIDVRAVSGRFTKAGVDAVERVGERPEGLRALGPGLDAVVDVDPDSAAPVADALDELLEFLEAYGPLRQLHSASFDMSQVAFAARELAEYRHVIGAPDPVPHDPYAVLGEAPETGLVIMYARPFTGHARLGDRWLPTAPGDHELHKKFIALRQDLAHYDWTPSRQLIDTRTMLGNDGPMILAEQRSRLSKSQLLALADLAELQRDRFDDAAGGLKHRLGAANAPSDDA
jgi:hypothetical protein